MFRSRLRQVPPQSCAVQSTPGSRSVACCSTVWSLPSVCPDDLARADPFPWKSGQAQLKTSSVPACSGLTSSRNLHPSFLLTWRWTSSASSTPINDNTMASEVLVSPTSHSGISRLSISSISQPSSSSGESPLNTPPFSILAPYSSDGGSDDESDIVPKIEELEDNVAPDSKHEPSSEATTVSSSPMTLRRRGRPRKYPPVTRPVVKGRSKTGCLTCRKRKKKCDEAKPSCMHTHHSLLQP